MTGKRLLPTAFLVMALMLVLVAVFQPGRGGRYKDVTFAISSPRKEYKFADPIHVSLRVENLGETVAFGRNPAWYERIPYLGRRIRKPKRDFWYRFELAVTGPSGRLCIEPQRMSAPYHDDYHEVRRITPGTNRLKEMIVNDFALISQPGTYTIAGRIIQTARIIETANAWSPTEVMRTQPIEVVVKPRSYEDMGRHIGELVEQIQAHIRAVDEGSEIPRIEGASPFSRLRYTRDNRIVPALLDLEHPGKGGLCAHLSFTSYLHIEPETKEMVLKSVRRRGLTRNLAMALRRLGCGKEEFDEVIAISLASQESRVVNSGVATLASWHRSDSHRQRLIELATDPNKPPGHSLIVAIAINPFERGMKAIEAWKDAADTKIARDVESSLDAVKHYSTIHKNLQANPIPSEVIAAAKDSANPSRWKAVRLILQSLSDKEYTVLEALVDNPSTPPPNRATKAAKVIAKLLAHPDRDVREAAITAIRLAWRI